MNTSCFECGNPADHNHHVVPRLYGGTQTVPLCLDCHGKIHGRKLTHIELLKEGIRRAKAAGKKWGGRPKGSFHKVTTEMIETILIRRSEGAGITQIAREMNLSRPTIYDVLNRDVSSLFV